jgi:Ca2+-binding EF-hand superfamily protein
MKTIALTLAATILSSTAALAATDVATFDADRDGFVTRAEIAQVYPGFSGSDFRAIDGNNDQRISAVELQNPDIRGVLGRYEAGSGAITGLGAIDGDADGFATFEELVVAYPGLTASDLRTIDTNNDRRVNARELYALSAQDVIARAKGSATKTDINAIDANGDGFASFGELQAAYPGLRATDFRVIDGNDDNRVSFGELYRLNAQVVLGRSGA